MNSLDTDSNRSNTPPGVLPNGTSTNGLSPNSVQMCLKCDTNIVQTKGKFICDDCETERLRQLHERRQHINTTTTTQKFMTNIRYSQEMTSGYTINRGGIPDGLNTRYVLEHHHRSASYNSLHINTQTSGGGNNNGNNNGTTVDKSVGTPDRFSIEKSKSSELSIKFPLPLAPPVNICKRCGENRGNYLLIETSIFIEKSLCWVCADIVILDAFKNHKFTAETLRQNPHINEMRRLMAEHSSKTNSTDNSYNNW